MNLRAREAGQADEPPASARAGTLDTQALIAEFKGELLPKIREAVSDQDFSVISAAHRRVTDAGDDERLVLAQPSVMLRDLTEQHRDVIAKATGMDVEIVKASLPAVGAARGRGGSKPRAASA